MKVNERTLGAKVIIYSLWVKEKEGKKIKQVLRQQKCSLIEFLDNVLHSTLVKSNFPEHLRKA